MNFTSSMVTAGRVRSTGCASGRRGRTRGVRVLIVAVDDRGHPGDRARRDAEVVVQVAVPRAADPALAHPPVVDDGADLGLAERAAGRRGAEVLRQVDEPGGAVGVAVRWV